MAARDGEQLPGSSVEGDGVVSGDDPCFVPAEDGEQVEFSGDGLPGGSRLCRGACEASPVARDEGAVERPGGLVEIGDAMAFEPGDEPVLEGATRAFSPSPGLGAVGEEESDGQLSQGPLKLSRGRDFAVGQLVAGGSEMAGSVEVEGRRQSVGGEQVQTDAEAAVAVFGRLEASDEGSSGGVVAGEDEAGRGVVGSEPGVGASVEKEALSLASAAFPSPPMLLESPYGPSDPQGP